MIEVLAIAPEPNRVLIPAPGTLTSGAIFGERTRWYSALRTRRLAHGIIDLLRELRAASATPLVLRFDRVDEADATDTEFLALALRRLDPAQVRLVIGSGGGAPSDALADARAEYAEILGVPVIPSESEDEATSSDAGLEEAARAFVWAECVSPDPAGARAYERIPDDLRRRLHDERADVLEALDERTLHLGAIPFHRQHGSDPRGAGRTAVMDAVTHCIGSAHYAQALELCDRLRPEVPEEDFTAFYIPQTKRAQCLAPLNRGEECEPVSASRRSAYTGWCSTASSRGRP